MTQQLIHLYDENEKELETRWGYRPKVLPRDWLWNGKVFTNKREIRFPTWVGKEVEIKYIRIDGYDKLTEIIPQIVRMFDYPFFAPGSIRITVGDFSDG